MTLVTLIEAKPRAAAGGLQLDVRLAGGGSRAYAGHRGFTDWLAGVEGPPKFSASIGFNEAGWTGFSRPTTAVVRVGCHSAARLSFLGGLFWNGAPIEVRTGDDETGSDFILRVRGVIAAVAVAGAYVELTISDVSRDIDKPLCSGTFAGTGGIEGTEEVTGRIKRRSWGYVFNVEGRTLDKAFNVYEFGDPAHPMQEFVAVKDKGFAGPTIFLGWQGSIDSTLAALRASTPPQGGAVVAPSIACVKWWTVPAGPLTADIRGDATGGYLAAPAEIVAKLLGEFAPSGLSNLAEATAFRPYESGLHVADADTTVSEAIDKTLLGVSLLWTVSPDASVTIREFTWSGGPVAVLRSQEIKRDAVYPPLRNRKIAYQTNNRIHTEGEISAALLTADDITYRDGTPIEVLKPGEAGANVTETRTAAAITGQGPSATDQRGLDPLFAPGQNALFNGSFKFGFAGWNNAAGWQLFGDFQGAYVAAPSGAEAVLQSLRGIPCSNGQPVSISGRFNGPSTGNSFVDIAWYNGGNGALVNFSSGYANVALWPAGSYNRERRGGTFASPVATDGSGYCVGFARLVSNGAGTFSQIKAEYGGPPTPFTDEASNSAVYQLGETIDALKPEEVGSNVTEDRVAAAVTGQGVGATSNSLYDLDPNAAAQLTAAGGGRTTVPLNTIITRALPASGAASCVAEAGSSIAGTGSGTARVLIEAAPSGTSSWTTIAISDPSSYSATEPWLESASGDLVNSSGVTMVYDIRARVTSSGTGGPYIEPARSYLTA